MRTKRTFAHGLSTVILALAFGMTTVSCNTSTDIELGDSVYNFRAFLSDLPPGPVSGGGRWLVWSTGNTISVVEEPGGARALRASIGGAHGVDILLTGDNGIGARQGLYTGNSWSHSRYRNRCGSRNNSLSQFMAFAVSSHPLGWRARPVHQFGTSPH